jgi:hypothetical protein
MADRDLDERAHQYWRNLAAQTQRQSAEALGMRTNQRQRIDEDEPETLRQRQRFTPYSRLGCSRCESRSRYGNQHRRPPLKGLGPLRTIIVSLTILPTILFKKFDLIFW